MKKVEKGQYGYLSYKKKQSAIFSIIGFLIVAILFFIGYFVTHTRNNIMTVISILTVLPVAKFAVNYLSLLSHHSEAEEEYEEVRKEAKEAFVLTDLVITTGKKVLPTAFLVIRNGNVCGYTKKEKYDMEYANEFLTNNLQANGVKANVKIFQDKKQFFKRVKTLSEMIPDEKQAEKDRRIKDILLTLTM